MGAVTCGRDCTREQPDKVAYVMAGSGDAVTYRELNDRSNQLAQLFWAAGLRFGDHIAILMENRPEYFEVCWAAQRSGLFYTAINHHFTADEAAYILDDCDAQVLVISDAYRELAADLVAKTPNVRIRLMVGDQLVDGYEPYADARDRFPAEPLAEEVEGTPMLYSSGTTGRPKGIKYKIKKEPIGAMPAQMGMLTAIFGMTTDSVYLSPAPLYHSAPLFYCMSTMRLGGTVDLHGAVRSRRRVASDRTAPHHAQPVGADHVRAHVEAARRRTRRATTCRRISVRSTPRHRVPSR